MKVIYSLLIVSILSGCASERVRTKWTDPAARVMVDPASIMEEDYVSINTALVQSGKWFVVDRASGLRAIKREQEALHRNEADRFDDKEKYAMWGKLYGVGAVVVGSDKCHGVQGFSRHYTVCNQYLSIIDANSGQVITAVKKEGVKSETDNKPEWDETVEALNDAFPRHWEPAKFDDEMNKYRAVAAEHAVRQKEELVKQQLDKK